MSFGIIEVITLLLGLAGFGLQANPKPPTADQALQYAIADADFAAHLDAVSIVPGNYKALAQLADQPRVRASPELQKIVRKAIGEIEGARGAAKMATGVDITTDISDVTAFVQLAPKSESRFVAAVRGRFSPANLDKIAKMVNKPTVRLDGGLLVEIGANEPVVGMTKDGVVLVGTEELVRERIASTWKAPSHDPGTKLAHMADVITARPVFAVSMTMSMAARAEVLKELAQGFGTDLVKRHGAATVAMFHDGIGWTWVDSTRAGLDDVELMSRGVLDLLRAAQIAPRGFAKIAMSVLNSYRGSSAEVDDLANHKAEILKIVESFTGDGNFKVTVDKNPRTLRLGVRATGKTVSEVLPGVLLPLGVVGFLAAEAKMAPAPVTIETASPPPKPATVSPGKPPTVSPPAAKPPARLP